jgi:CubicO group peptidase (beta-lactamase class C family)
MKHLAALLLALTLSQIVFGQQPSGHPFTLDQLKDSIQVTMKRQHLMGVMVGITTKDSVIFSGGFGFANKEKNISVTGSTLFRMGSITKMFVSLGIMKLVERGQLQLEDKLQTIAPEVPFENEWETTNPVRIVHLLEHTSGFDDIKLNHMYALDTAQRSGKDMMLIHQSSFVCRWKPGERTAYSNPNYAVLGYVIEKISGKPHEAFLKEIILDPLGMRSSNFNLRSKFPEHDVAEYTFKQGAFVRVPSVTLLSGPQGALWSSSDDMVKFLQLFLNDGKGIVQKQTIHEIETPHSSLAARSGLQSAYALGNRIGHLYNKYPYRGHDGITGTCYSSCFYNRDIDIGFVISSNSDHGIWEIEQLVLGYIEQNLPGVKLITQKTDHEKIKPFLGWYQFESPRNEINAFSERLQNFQHVFVEGDDLYMKPLTGNSVKLLQTAALTFTMEGMNSPLIVFVETPEGRVMSIAGSYWQRTPAFPAIGKRILAVLAILFSLSTFILAPMAIILKLLKKITWSEFLFRLLPATGIVTLMFVVVYLFDIKDHSYKLYELTSFNIRTFSVFTGTLIFAVTGITYLLFALLTFRKRSNRWLAWYLILTSLSINIVMAVLLQAGWIGLQTWRM